MRIARVLLAGAALSVALGCGDDSPQTPGAGATDLGLRPDEPPAELPRVTVRVPQEQWPSIRQLCGGFDYHVCPDNPMVSLDDATPEQLKHLNATKVHCDGLAFFTPAEDPITTLRELEKRSVLFWHPPPLDAEATKAMERLSEFFAPVRRANVMYGSTAKRPPAFSTESVLRLVITTKKHAGQMAGSGGARVRFLPEKRAGAKSP